MAKWIAQAEAERVLRPVLYQADVRVGHYTFASRWLRVVRGGEQIVVSFEHKHGESIAAAVDRLVNDLSQRLGLVGAPAAIDI